MYDGWPSGAVVPISLFSLQETAGSLTLIKTLWPGGSMWLKFLQVSPEMLQNPLNKSLSSMNVSCCSAIVLYYLWLLLWLSEFIAIISQQPSDALGQQSVTLLLGWREWKGHMQWQGTQSSGQACGKDDAILLPESWWDLDGGKRERERPRTRKGESELMKETGHPVRAPKAKAPEMNGRCSEQRPGPSTWEGDCTHSGRKGRLHSQ